MPAVQRRPKRDWRAFINKLEDHGRHRQPYADTTIEGMGYIGEKWQLFCCEELQQVDADGTLRCVNPSTLKAFFQWLIDTAKKPQQAPTLLQYFRLLKMIYRDATGCFLDPGVVSDVNAYISFHAEGRKEISPRPKPVISGEDFVRLLHFIYTEDRTGYPNERHRVQQAFLMIVHGSGGLRPSSTTRTSRKRKRKAPGSGPPNDREGLQEEDAEVTKLRYGDIKLKLSRDEEGRKRFMIQPKFTHFKGEKRRAQHKTFTWSDKANVLECPVAHLVALALHDRAFKIPSLRNARAVFSLQVPAGEDELVLRWHDDLLNTPIFRASSHDVSELQNSVASNRLKNLGLQMGYENHLGWYCIRRMVLNAVDGSGSEEARNQIAGHLDGRTYRNHYQDQHIHVDVPGLVRGEKTEDALIRKWNNMGINADPNANRPLSPGEIRAIQELPDVVALRSDYENLAETVKAKYGTLKQAPDDDILTIQCRQAQKDFRARKALHQSQLQSRRRQEYFSLKSDALIEAQLDGSDECSFTRREKKATVHSVPERAYLAGLADVKENMRAESMQDQRIIGVQAMADLCGRVDVARKSASGGCFPPVRDTVPSAEQSTGEDFPLQCHKLQCIFCLGDERQTHQDRTRRFARHQVLWKHVANHFAAIDPRKMMPCPHPLCRRESFAANDLQHLKNHVLRRHGITLSKD